MTLRQLLIPLVLGSYSLNISAQSTDLWRTVPLVSATRQGRIIIPDQALGIRLDTTVMRDRLAHADRGSVRDLPSATAVITLPLPNGAFQRFLYLETPLMEDRMRDRYPFIRTYSGFAVNNAMVRVKFDLTPTGFHAMITGLPEGDAFIDPLAMGNSVDHQVYWKRDLRAVAGRSTITCTYDQVNDVPHAMAQSEQWITQLGDARAGDCQFRTYRLALACTGEYANYFGATGANRSPAIAAMATTLNRVNGIYEREAALTMVLVANNDQLVFTNPTTDGYTNNDGGAMLDENQTKCDAVIGSANYDIGHVFSTGGGGVAYLNSPCTGYKAGGVTGSSAPVADPFDIDYVAHEMGHQYGGNHTQNNNCNRAGQAAVEVGSGITIMGYAGVCSPNVEDHSIAMMGGYSLQEIYANITGGNSSGCPQTVPLVNAPPSVSAGVDRTIPKSTPFVLTAAGTDSNAGDNLTYSWEQMDYQPSTQPPVASSTLGPNFRPWLPTTSPQRWFPKLSTLASGTTPSPNWEVLANVSRSYKFRVTVRDNAMGGGCNGQDNMIVTVNGSTGPFLVIQPNTALTWPAMSGQTVTWDPAGTAGSPVSCANVDILLSTDGGLTYPYTLATSTPNDGNAPVILPNVASTTARVMVRASGNIFFDISDHNFTITAPEQVLIHGKVLLEGPYVGGSLMQDDLRVAGLLPTMEPYTALGFAQSGGGGGESCTAGMLAVTGANAVVDWVRLELRAQGTPSMIIATRQGLLQRDGDIVDVDGTSPVSFPVQPGNYYVAVRHRNHLGCMTSQAIALGGASTTVDFSSSTTATFGTDARKSSGTSRLLWMGNTWLDNKLSYTGAQNDRDPILSRIGGAAPTGSVQGYFLEDCSMDGIVRYTGADNDRDPILLNIMGNLPTDIRTEQLP